MTFLPLVPLNIPSAIVLTLGNKVVLGTVQRGSCQAGGVGTVQRGSRQVGGVGTIQRGSCQVGGWVQSSVGHVR